MAKSKGRLLAELLASDGKVKESKSALDISGGKLAPSDIPTLPNSKLENSSISIAGHSTSLGGSVTLNTGDISEHTNYKYYTDARVRAAISASGDLSYNSSTGVISFSASASPVISVNSLTGSVVLDTGDIAESGNLYHTTARARAAISASGNAISYNSSTGVISSTFEESPTFTGHVSVQGNLNVGNSSAGNLIFKRPSANYIWADQTSGYFIFGTNARGTSYANRAMALTADNDANFGRDVNVVRQVSAPIYYDSDNTAYYVNPATGSILNNLDMRGTNTTLPGHAYSNTHGGTNVYWHVGTAAGSTNKVLNLRVYKSDNTSYTTHKFTTTGIEVAEALKIGTTTVIDSSRNFIANTRLTFDYNDHYLEPGTGNLTLKNASNAALVTLGQESQFNGTVTVNSHVSGIGDINFGKAISGHNTSSPARITASSNGQLYLDSTQNQHIYLGWYNGSGYDVVSEMNARFASYKDRSDTAYFVNPAGASLIRNLEIKGTTSDSTTDALHIRNSGGTTQSYFRNDGTVIIGGSQYLYVTASAGAYFSNSIKARGGIHNDQGDLLLNDNVAVSGYTNMTGQLSFTANNTAIRMRDSAGAYTRTMILNGSNAMYIGPVDAYAGGSILYGASSNVSGQTFYVGGNARLAVTGSGITVTGTITGDITGTVTGTATQAANLNNHTTNSLTEGSNNLYYTDTRVGSYLSNNGYATQSTIVAAITDSAPTTLDTLNELAAALGDDANFSTTVTNSIATKAPLASPSLTGNTSIAGNLMMTNTTSHIELGSYLKLYGATASNTGTIAINANYGGAQTDSWTADYSGDVNAGMWLLRQSSGGSGTMQVYQKKHGTSSGSHARSTFTKTAEFNIDGYFYGRNLRSERYYSSDNTAYYTDPSETSVIKQILINGASNNSGKADFAVGAGGDPQVSWNSNQVQIGGTDMNWNGKINYGSNIFSMAAWDAQIDFFIQGGTTSRNIVFKPSNAGTATERLTIYGDTGVVQAGGSIRSTSEMRAPHYYDIDNTVYYTNPATTSVMNTIQLGTNSSPTLSDVAEYLNVQTSHGYFRVGPGNGSYNHIITDRPQHYFNKKLVVDEGIVRSYDEDLQLDRAGSTTARIRITNGITYTDQPLTVTGNVQHTGLTMTSGSDVDQLYTVTVSAQLTTSWQDTGINGSDLSTGTYIVQIYADSDVPRYHYQEFYSGIMSWSSAGTNSNEVDEITLHRAGHAPNDGNIFLRTLRHPSGGDNLMLQLRATHNSTSASNYIFKFRRMI